MKMPFRSALVTGKLFASCFQSSFQIVISMHRLQSSFSIVSQDLEPFSRRIGVTLVSQICSTNC
jgi:hypothetical protein